MTRMLESRIAIDAPPEQVWRVLTDFASYPEWNPFVTSLVGEPTVGTRLRVRINPPGGRGITLEPEVMVSEPGRHFAWLGRLGLPRIFDGRHDFVLEPDGRGGTAFTQRETFRGLLVPLVGSVLKRTERGFAEMNEALKQRCESLTSKPTPRDAKIKPVMHIRTLGADDYDYVIERVDDWWGGRPMRAMLSRLFFIHFTDTSFVATVDDRFAGFLCGFLSQSRPDEAYIHFVGVDPELRSRGVARALYEQFFAAARAAGRRRVGCVTGTVNDRSIAFHDAMGFSRETVDDYDGPGQARVVFRRDL